MLAEAQTIDCLQEHEQSSALHVVQTPYETSTLGLCLQSKDTVKALKGNKANTEGIVQGHKWFKVQPAREKEDERATQWKQEERHHQLQHKRTQKNMKNNTHCKQRPRPIHQYYRIVFLY